MKILLKSIKLLALLIILQVTFMFNSGFSYKDNKANAEPQYYVVVAYENGYTKAGQPVVSNVVYANCNWHSGLMVSNQFNTYYGANFSKSRGHTGLVRANTFSFNTRDQAEAERREIISRLNYDWSPLLTTHFSVLCED
jgi:hypothetical protein